MRRIRTRHATVGASAKSSAHLIGSCPRADARGVSRGIDLLMPSDVDDELRLVCCRLLSLDVSHVNGPRTSQI